MKRSLRSMKPFQTSCFLPFLGQKKWWSIFPIEKHPMQNWQFLNSPLKLPEYYIFYRQKLLQISPQPDFLQDSLQRATMRAWYSL